MKAFRDAKIQILVASDLAARGLDVEGVTHVVNYDIPHDVDWYVHRIGRTGRAGNEGEAITLYTADEVKWLRNIETKLGILMERQNLEGGVVHAASLWLPKRKSPQDLSADAIPLLISARLPKPAVTAVRVLKKANKPA